VPIRSRRLIAGVRVTVNFTGKERPDGYMLKIEPEGD